MCAVFSGTIVELVKARWEHIDFESATWMVPEESVKLSAGLFFQRCAIWFGENATYRPKLFRLRSGALCLSPGSFGFANSSPGFFYGKTFSQGKMKTKTDPTCHHEANYDAN